MSGSESGGADLPTPQQICDKAQDCMRLGNLAEAERLLRDLVQAVPDDARAAHDYGLLSLMLGRFEAGLALMRRAVALAPAEAVYAINLGAALRRLHRVDEAEAAFRGAIEADPGFVKALTNLAMLLQERGRSGEAGMLCRRALEIAPGAREALYLLALSHRFLPGDPLVGEIERQLAGRPPGGAGRGLLLAALGKARDDLGDYGRAFACYREANEERARRVRFDPVAHRNRIAAIRAAFPAPRLCGDDTPDPVTPVFVVGMPRSGKTLVESLLDRHPAVTSAGEARDWRRVLGEVLKEQGVSEPFPGFAQVLTEAQLREVGRRYLEALRQRRDVPGTRFRVSTLPGNYIELGLIFRAFPAVKVIHCRRDPLDHCLFIYFKHFAQGHEYSCDLRNLAAYYLGFREMMAHWQRLYGDRILTVDYEALVREPVETARRLFGFCGLDLPTDATGMAFGTGEIGHARHYAAELAPVRAALGL